MTHAVADQSASGFDYEVVVERTIFRVVRTHEHGEFRFIGCEYVDLLAGVVIKHCGWSRVQDRCQATLPSPLGHVSEEFKPALQLAHQMTCPGQKCACADQVAEIELLQLAPGATEIRLSPCASTMIRATPVCCSP